MEAYGLKLWIEQEGNPKWESTKPNILLSDMDFRCPTPVIEALHAEVEYGLFGYSLPPKELFDVICERLIRQYDWEIKPSWIVWLP